MIAANLTLSLCPACTEFGRSERTRRARPAPTSQSAPVSELCVLHVSAFSSPNLSSFNSNSSSGSLVSFVDAPDAASSISPLSATLTKNTRGGGHILLAKSSLSEVWPIVHSLLSPISFGIRTYAKRARNPFRMNTSKTPLKSFRMNTYEKRGRGLVAQASACALHSRPNV